LTVPPRTTAIGALAYYVSHADPRHYEPSNITFGIMQPLERGPRGKLERKLAMSARALNALEEWRRGRALVSGSLNEGTHTQSDLAEELRTRSSVSR
jgi:folate-dependent tRNA-U54 methylase TrmFO/GidA